MSRIFFFGICEAVKTGEGVLQNPCSFPADSKQYTIWYETNFIAHNEVSARVAVEKRRKQAFIKDRSFNLDS